MRKCCKLAKTWQKLHIFIRYLPYFPLEEILMYRNLTCFIPLHRERRIQFHFNLAKLERLYYKLVLIRSDIRSKWKWYMYIYINKYTPKETKNKKGVKRKSPVNQTLFGRKWWVLACLSSSSSSSSSVVDAVEEDEDSDDEEAS